MCGRIPRHYYLATVDCWHQTLFLNLNPTLNIHDHCMAANCCFILRWQRCYALHFPHTKRVGLQTIHCAFQLSPHLMVGRAQARGDNWRVSPPPTHTHTSCSLSSHQHTLACLYSSHPHFSLTFFGVICGPTVALFADMRSRCPHNGPTTALIFPTTMPNV